MNNELQRQKHIPADYLVEKEISYEGAHCVIWKERPKTATSQADE